MLREKEEEGKERRRKAEERRRVNRKWSSLSSGEQRRRWRKWRNNSFSLSLSLCVAGPCEAFIIRETELRKCQRCCSSSAAELPGKFHRLRKRKKKHTTVDVCRGKSQSARRVSSWSNKMLNTRRNSSSHRSKIQLLACSKTSSTEDETKHSNRGSNLPQVTQKNRISVMLSAPNTQRCVNVPSGQGCTTTTETQ